MFVLDAGGSGTRGNGRSLLRLESLPGSRLCTGPFDIHTFKPHCAPAKKVVSCFPCEGNRTKSLLWGHTSRSEELRPASAERGTRGEGDLWEPRFCGHCLVSSEYSRFLLGAAVDLIVE